MRARRPSSAADRPAREHADPGPILRVLLLVLPCWLFVAASSALAHDPVFRFRPDWESLFDLNRSSSVAIGDLNGDGFLDVVFGNEYNPVTAYLNVEGELAPTPSWETVDTHYTYDVALLDIDGDGDADLVHAARDVRVLRNVAGEFDETPIWSGDREAWTHAVALGDVDGDGDLDLACGNGRKSNTIYLNEGGTFAPEPAWRSVPEYYTTDLMFGDVDGDGDLDLVCLNGTFGSYEPITLYLNDGQSLATSPAWTSAGRNTEGELALGDCDGDGDLDLACTNGRSPARLYLNTGGGFGATPVWSSGAIAAPQSIGLLDADGDGDIDIVCGTAAANAMFANRGNAFPVAPDWTSEDLTNTLAMAFGDLDRDGDLDLVCANENAANSSYVNEGGTVGGMPGWWMQTTYLTYSLAVGDIDGDGTADLVCGNYGQPSAAYPGQDGFFSRVAGWTAGAGAETGAVALADLNDDGRLDLICGNGGNDPAPNTIYLNDGAWFPAEPSWTADTLGVTGSVALGDIDNDGDLDLACGNGNVLSSERNAVYLNDGGVMGATPSWRSWIWGKTNSVALADITGNGYLDLVCGNPGTNYVYTNDGGQLSNLPNWQSAPASETHSIAVGDVDGDGDLDVVCGNDGENALYRNEGGALETSPSWLSSESAWTRSVALSDIDDDGDLDLVCGNGYASAYNSIYLNEGGTFGSSPAWTALLPDDTKAVAVLDVDQDGDGDIISADGREGWGYINIAMNRWNRQPLLTPEPRTIEFSAVTVGDTLPGFLAFKNVGRRPLVVDEVILPTAQMRLLPDGPFTIEPGASELLTIIHEPLATEVIGDYVIVRSNDFATPTRAIPITAPIIPLRVQHRLVNTAQEIPLGEATTVIVSPLDGARVEGGFLYHRPAATQAAFTDSVALSPWSGEFIATIPGEFVTESGLEFYVRVFNSGILATDPANAPRDSVVFQAVAAPSAIGSAAIPNFGTEYRAGLPLTVGVSLQQGTQFLNGAVHYRQGGASAYRTRAITSEPPLLVATIPGDSVGARGFEYYVEVVTPAGVLTDPPDSPALRPKTLAVAVYDLAEDAPAPGGAYRLASVPLDFGGRTEVTLESLLADQPEFGPYDPVFWRSFRYDPAAAEYRELGEEGAEDLFSLTPGRAFWLVCRAAARIETTPVAGHSTATDSSYAIELAPGWNQVGNPFAFPVAWDSVRVAGGDPLAEVVEPPVAWVSGTGYQDSVPVLEPWQGCWVKNISDPPRPVVLEVPAREAPAPMKAVRPQDGWRLAIRASAAGAVDRNTRLGCAPSAASGWDPSDRSEPPPSPVRGLSVFFPHGDWSGRPGRYTADIRAPLSGSDGSAGQRWSFDVAKNFREEGAGNTVELDFVGVETIPVECEVSLLDRELDRVQDLRESASYEFHLGTRDPVTTEAEARFVVLVGAGDFVDGQLDELTAPPLRTALHQNYPNPFNPETVIRCDVAEAGRAELKIYDLAGRLVKTVHSGVVEPGGYEFVWRGEDDGGRRVASGVYVYRLVAGSVVQNRRLTLIK